MSDYSFASSSKNKRDSLDLFLDVNSRLLLDEVSKPQSLRRSNTINTCTTDDYFLNNKNKRTGAYIGSEIKNRIIDPDFVQEVKNHPVQKKKKVNLKNQILKFFSALKNIFSKDINKPNKDE